MRLRQDETRREGEVEALLFLLPRPRRELASVLAPTQRRAPPREMAPPRGRRRDQPRASGERRSAATMRRNVVTFIYTKKRATHGPLRWGAGASRRTVDRRRRTVDRLGQLNMQPPVLHSGATLADERRQMPSRPAGERPSGENAR